MEDWAERWARDFHDTYERTAPQFGYETRPESAKPWAEVPEKNRKLMIAVCAEVLCRFMKWRDEIRETINTTPPTETEWMRKAAYRIRSYFGPKAEFHIGAIVKIMAEESGAAHTPGETPKIASGRESAESEQNKAGVVTVSSPPLNQTVTDLAVPSLSNEPLASVTPGETCPTCRSEIRDCYLWPCSKADSIVDPWHSPAPAPQTKEPK